MKKIAIQGIAGSYSDEAAHQIFAGEIEIVECVTFAETVAAVVEGRADNAVLPVANKIVGEISDAVSEAAKAGLTAELTERLVIAHMLIGSGSADIGTISAVRSHPYALQQCSRFFSDHSDILAVPYGDTATSVRSIINEKAKHLAAIGSEHAAELYGGKILMHDIANMSDNWTDFSVFEIR